MIYLAIVFLPALVGADWTWSEGLLKIKESLVESRRVQYEEIRCHSCTTMNASEIIGGSGIHPGVYLTSLLLSSIPVTYDCIDPPDTDENSPFCDQGVCVKINYTARHSGRTDVLRACLPRSKGVFKQLCTDFVSSQAHGTWCVCGDDLCNSAPLRSTTLLSILSIIPFLLCDVQDQNWRRWLENVRFVPNTDECNDSFAPEIALRSGVRSQECENGVCMKMWFREKNGKLLLIISGRLVLKQSGVEKLHSKCPGTDPF
ncbi:hypothetical protein FO519_006041 [Halicephalobus sp. NKZ332]|nr:hypothetical protein FO519_006041 [Halicephalobus sp. NKZ332]